MNRYIKRLALMIPPVKRRYDDLENLRKENESIKLQFEAKLREYEARLYEYEAGYGCSFIQQFSLIFDGRVDTENAGFSFCCEPLPNIPRTALRETGKESIESFIAMREKILASSRTELHNGCAECSCLRREIWQNENLIHYVNLSMYPSPCDCMCVYCLYRENDSDAFTRAEVIEGYEKVFDTLDYAKKEGLIASDAGWQVSAGEITIHPYRDRIMDLIKKQSVRFCTNCFRFDKEIGKHLAANPRSCINLSIDSGTPETWHKVKGVNNFKVIVDNLAKYYKSSSRDGQIGLKYILLPDINDNHEDYSGVIGLMKNYGVNALDLSCDVRCKYNKSEEEAKKLIRAVGTLVAMLIKNRLKHTLLNNFSPSEQTGIETFAEELLNSSGEN